MNKKVIFLDIDGVLNNFDDIMHHSPDTFNPELPQDKHLEILKEIVDKTEAEIVLSSGWRCTLDGTQDVLDALYRYGMTLRGVTPEGTSEALIKKLFPDVKPFNTDSHYLYSTDVQEKVVYDRGAEIATWLHKHPEYTNFVILDDEVNDIKKYFPNNYIKTDLVKGLLKEHIIPCINILNRGE